MFVKGQILELSQSSNTVLKVGLYWFALRVYMFQFFIYIHNATFKSKILFALTLSSFSLIQFLIHCKILSTGAVQKSNISAQEFVALFAESKYIFLFFKCSSIAQASNASVIINQLFHIHHNLFIFVLARSFLIDVYNEGDNVEGFSNQNCFKVIFPNIIIGGVSVILFNSSEKWLICLLILLFSIWILFIWSLIFFNVLFNFIIFWLYLFKFFLFFFIANFSLLIFILIFLLCIFNSCNFVSLFNFIEFSDVILFLICSGVRFSISNILI